MGQTPEGAVPTDTHKRRVILLSFGIWIVGVVLTISSYHLIEWLFPGRVRVRDVDSVASVVYLVLGGFCALLVVARSRVSRWSKALLVLVFVSISLFFSFVTGIHSTCGDEPTYLGEAPSSGEGSCDG